MSYRRFPSWSLMLLALAFAGAPTASAGTVIMDFNGIAPISPFGEVPGPYREDGFTLTAFLTEAPNVLANFGVFGPPDPRYTGTRSLYLWSMPTTALLTRDGGGLFSLVSIDLSKFGTGVGVSVTFNGIKADASVVTQTFTLARDFGMHTFALTGFTDLVSVNWNNGLSGFDGLHQFDNIVINIDATAVPEPSSACLLGMGMFTCGAARLWRKRNEELKKATRTASRFSLFSLERRQDAAPTALL